MEIAFTTILLLIAANIYSIYIVNKSKKLNIEIDDKLNVMKCNLDLTYSKLKNTKDDLESRNSQLCSIIENLQLGNNELKEEILLIDTNLTKKYDKEKAFWQATEERKIRKDSIERSRSIIRGQATEHLAPLTMPNLNIKDYRFLGNPIDYIVFSGASNITDKVKDAQFDKIIFLEIKSGKSKLNTIQRRIRDAVKLGKVEFTTYNPDTQEIKTTIQTE